MTATVASPGGAGAARRQAPNPSVPPTITAAIAIAAVIVGGTLGFGAWRLAAPAPPGEATVAVMQPSIEQPLKFEPGHAATTVAIYISLTQRAGAQHPDLIVWPETALPSVLRRDIELLRALGSLS